MRPKDAASCSFDCFTFDEKERREGRLDQPRVVNLPAAAAPPAGGGPPPGMGQCPKCGGLALVYQEGCDLCTACGYSRCG